MKKLLFPALVFIFFLISYSYAQQHKFQTDTIKTEKGNLKITFIGHASLMFEYNNLVIDVDPVSRYADYSTMPKADIILVTHQHGDHFDTTAIKQLEKNDTRLIYTRKCSKILNGGTIMENGDFMSVEGVEVVAVPAYNIEHKRKNGEFYHPKGAGNGYVMRFGIEKVYIAGDTENIPEMKNLKNIDIAFLPMNLPYTMTPEMVFDAVKMFRPKILYPYHTGNTDVNKLLVLMKNEHYCEVRIRDMK